MREPLRHLRRLEFIAVAGALLSVVACGPDLNSAGSGDVTGKWFSSGPAAGLSNITMTLAQTADGSITGTFTAAGTRGEQQCPTTGPCLISSTLKGVNTVLQVNLQLKDSGTFTGQLINPDLLHGAMAQATTDFIDFHRVP